MKSLVYLILSYNQLTGPIPKSLGQLGQLFDLELHNNYLTSIPPTLGENMKSLTSLSLGFNKLSGPIAKELASIPNLIALFLENNFLNGSIPEELGGGGEFKTVGAGPQRVDRVNSTVLARSPAFRNLAFGKQQAVRCAPGRLWLQFNRFHCFIRYLLQQF